MAGRSLLSRRQALSAAAVVAGLAGTAGLGHWFRQRESWTGGDPGELERLLARSQPFPVSLSPDAQLLLRKRKTADRFALEVIDRASGSQIAEHVSERTQLALSWHPHRRAVAFLMADGATAGFGLHWFELGQPAPTMIAGVRAGAAVEAMRFHPDGDDLLLAGGPTGDDLWLVGPIGGRTTPRALVRGLAGPNLFAWGDSDAIVAIAGAPPRLRVLDRSGQTLADHALPAGRLRDLAIDAGGAAIVATREEGESFYRLVRISLRDGSSARVVDEPGDLRNAQPLPSGAIAYLVTAQGGRRPRVVDAAGAPPRDLAPLLPEGVAELRGSILGGTRLGVAHTPTTGPTRLLSIDPRTGLTEVVAESGTGEVPRVTAPLEARGGELRVWRADAPRGAVVLVHGGPHLEVTRAWSDDVAALRERGLHVLAVNYRGSTGRGAAYEEHQVREAEQQIGEAVLHARSELGIAADHLVVYAQSYGVLLACGAMPRIGAEIAGMVLAAVPRPDRALVPQAAPRRLAVFHGREDPVPVDEARRIVESVLGPGVLGWPRARFAVLEGEGHHFHRLASQARILAAIETFAAG